jgi:protoporphyrinogen oxidase
VRNELTIIGAGATGLVLAYLAAKSGRRVRILESSKTIGGLLATTKTKGDPLEFFYHHFFTHDAEINWLLGELRLRDQIFYKPTVMGVFRSEKIYNFTTALDLAKFRPLGWLDKARFAASSLFLSRCGDYMQYENVGALDWFYKYAGKNVTEAIWRPMLDIKFGRYAADVPLTWMIGRLQQRLASRSGGREQLGYLRGSLQVLVDALERELRSMGVEIFLNTPVERLEISGDSISGLKLRDGRLATEKVVCTVPTPYLTAMLDDRFAQYRRQLEKIEYFGAVCGMLFMNKPLSHVYWLNVADPGYPFGGVIEHTNFISPDRYGGEHIAYLSRYVEADNPLLTQNEEEVCTEWMNKLKGIYPNFSPAQVNSMRLFRTKTAAVVCDKNFSKRLPAVATPIRGLSLINMMHVYPDERSVNNCIRLAAEGAKQLGILQNVPVGRSLAGRLGFGNTFHNQELAA